MILVSLIGEQPIPNLLPVRYLIPEQTQLVYTSKTRNVAQRLRRIISDSDNLRADIQVDAYDLDRILSVLRAGLADQKDVMFNLTGGTKMMVIAAFALAAQTAQPLVYLQSEGRKSLLYRYAFQQGLPTLEAKEEIPPVITAAEYLRAHLPGFIEEGFSRDKQGDLNEGGCFEKAVYSALKSRFDEVLAGVRPQGVGDQIEIDLVIRCGNQVGIAEVKLGGGESPKRGLDQLKMAGEPTYLGTYTIQFLIVAQPRLQKDLAILARERNIEFIPLPDYRAGLPLIKADAERLANTIHKNLCN